MLASCVMLAALALPEKFGSGLLTGCFYLALAGRRRASGVDACRPGGGGDHVRRAGAGLLATTPTSTSSAPPCAPATRRCPPPRRAGCPRRHAQGQARPSVHGNHRLSRLRRARRSCASNPARSAPRSRRPCSTASGPRTASTRRNRGVLAQRESLRQQEITTLQSAATAYMDVLRDTAVLGLRRNNIKVLEVQLQQTRDRFQVGEVTRTDVAQAESSLRHRPRRCRRAPRRARKQHRLVPAADRRPAQAISRRPSRSSACCPKPSTRRSPSG